MNTYLNRAWSGLLLASAATALVFLGLTEFLVGKFVHRVFK